jgi:hypothetical protein
MTAVIALVLLEARLIEKTGPHKQLLDKGDMRKDTS